MVDSVEVQGETDFFRSHFNLDTVYQGGRSEVVDKVTEVMAGFMEV